MVKKIYSWIFFRNGVVMELHLQVWLLQVEFHHHTVAKQYQGQQNDYIILSLVRTKAVGHLRDIRRLVVAVSRARLGLYVFCRKSVFCNCHELRRTMDKFAAKSSKLQLVKGELFPTERLVGDDVHENDLHEVNDIADFGALVHSMQHDHVANQLWTWNIK